MDDVLDASDSGNATSRRRGGLRVRCSMELGREERPSDLETRIPYAPASPRTTA